MLFFLITLTFRKRKRKKESVCKLFSYSINSRIIWLKSFCKTYTFFVYHF